MDITAAHPGGNIVVESIDGDTVTLHQDLRDTVGWWFYWNFRVRGAAGRTATFRFTNHNVFAARGPCYSPDGRAWRWLGRECVDVDAFRFTFGQRGTGYFGFCIPYVERNLREFVARRPRIAVSSLTRSEKGHAVERLTLRSRRGTFKVPLVARSHACESMANYVLEGILDAWLGAIPESAFLQEHVDLQAVPFLDKDGVEEGDQGKNRAPHDHNRDYRPSGVWKSPRALMKQATGWRGDVRMMLDLHCPWIRGERNEEIGIPPLVDRYRRRYRSPAAPVLAHCFLRPRTPKVIPS